MYQEKKNPSDLVATAKGWIGTPYHHNACVKGAGVDCGQFLIGVFHEAGLEPLLDVGEYSNDWYLHRDRDVYLEHLKKYFDSIDKEDLQPGDVIAFSYGRTVSHTGIYVGGDLFIHSYVGKGVIYSSLNETEFIKRYHSCWRYKRWADSLATEQQLHRRE